MSRVLCEHCQAFPFMRGTCQGAEKRELALDEDRVVKTQLSV